MPDPIEGAISENPTPAATGEPQGNVETPVAPQDASSVTPTPEGTETPQGVDTTGTATTEEQPKVPEHFRRGYEALEKDVKEKYKPLADAVDQLGGPQVLDALKPIAELMTNEAADQATVVTTLKEALLPQHLEALAWAALDSPTTQKVILQDPDVRQVIADTFFDGRSIEEIQATLEGVPADDELDPETARLRQEVNGFKQQQKQAQEQAEAQLRQQRTQELEKRFFVDTAADVVRQFSLAAPDGASEIDKQLFADNVEDFQYAAQGRFLKENADSYLQIQDMYARGLATQARIAEARLHNKWQATLIKTAERFSKHGEAYSEAARLKQEQKIQGVRPDVTGNVPNTPQLKEERYDPDAPDFLTKFMADFKRDAATRA